MCAKSTAIFIGNSIFGDDRICLLVGEDLRVGLEGRGLDVRVIERTGFALLDCLEGYESAVVVDCICDERAPVGKVIPLSVEDFSAIKPAAPHYSGVPEAVGLMKDLGLTVPDISIIGVNVRNPYSLSSEIAADLSSMKDKISAEVCTSILGGLGRDG